MRFHIFRVLAAFACTFILTVSLGACSREQDPIVIGAILVMTDANDTPVLNGREVVRGMRFAIEKLNSRGGLGGRPFTLELRDCRMDPTEAREQFKELVAAGAVAVISNYSHISQALVPMATELKTTHLAIMATMQNLTLDAPYSFRYWTQSSDVAKALLPLVKKLGVKRLGLININNDYGNSVSDALLLKAVENGIGVEKVVYHSVEGDLSEKVRQIGDVDAIGFTCFPDDILAVSAAIRESHPDVEIIGPMSVASHQLFRNQSLEGIYIPAPLIYNTAKRKNTLFFLEFVETFDLSADLYSASGYDSIIMLYSVFEKVGLDSDAVAEFLGEGFVYPGLFGDVFGRPGSHHFPFTLRPALLKDGKLEFFRR